MNNRTQRRSILMPATASPLQRMHKRAPSTLSVASTASSRDHDDVTDTAATDAKVPGKITVSIRLKPALAASQPPASAWVATPTTLASPEVGSFSFDQVFGPSASSKEVYDSVARKVVFSVLDGYHGTIFAYGMTGTGKTYSMQGLSTAPGIIPLAISDIFSHISFATSTVSLSYLEIYNERVKDLLNPSVSSDQLKLHDTASGLVRVRNLRCVRAATEKELLDLIAQGDLARKTEGTEYNSVSSRSHAVLQMFIERTDPLTAATSTSVLSLCDLAGSERAASDAERRKEGAYINRSLLALGTIIARLSAAASEKSGSEPHDHIPYRDSKLTRLLQHSLSGGALVSVLCTVDTNSTNRHSVGETVNTLRFAARAKNVAITPARAMTATVTTSAAANVIIEGLRLDLERERAETEVLKVELAGLRLETMENSEREKLKYAREMRELEMQRDALKDKVSHLTRLILGGGGVGLTGPAPAAVEKRVASAGSNMQQHSDELNRYKSRVEELENKLAMTNIINTTVTAQSAENVVLEKLKDAESEIKELKEYLADKDRMISALKRASAVVQQHSSNARPHLRNSGSAMLKDHDRDEDHPLRPLDVSVMNIDGNGVEVHDDESLVVAKMRRVLM